MPEPDNFQDPLADFFPPTEGERVQQTVRENDNTFFIGDNASGLYRDRFEYDRATILSECLRAWRVSPVARRIVKLYTQFIVGEGLTIKADHTATQKFLLEWWNHPLNKLSEQIPQWCDERTRAGNLFFLISAMPDGMSFIRAVPSELIKEIQTAENDIMQEQYYIPVIQEAGTWKAYDPTEPVLGEGGNPDAFMLHYTANKPVGVVWGEPDLAPLLPWIGRYSTWLEDRVRLNHFRSAFMYAVSGNYENEAARKAREREINANPPKSGSVLVMNANQGEQWGILSANLDAFDASVDGLALKKMIALGAGIPLHYLAEPESSTSTTADAAGTPTFRGLEQTQTEFTNMIIDLATIAVHIRKEVDRRVNPNAKIEIEAPDITERDNSNLALAASRIEPVAADLFDRELIDGDEVLRLTYRMGGEVYEEGKNKAKGKRRPLKPAEGATPTSDIKKEPDPKDDKEPM
jgi:hypothetical protein